MMHFNYVCIDDAYEEVGRMAAIISDKCPALDIEVRAPIPFDKEIDNILGAQPDGLILDLRLDEFPNEDSILVNYRAMSLAQELRTRMTSGELKPVPILLWSSDEKILHSYQPDRTGHDLFDHVMHKGNVTRDKNKMQSQLISLARGYSYINETLNKDSQATLKKILGLSEGANLPDPRIGEELTITYPVPAHDFAAYTLNNIIRPTGVLVDEMTLSARLGIDPKKSAEWPDLLGSELKESMYSGIFHEAWPRWWMQGVRNWWQDYIGSSKPLERLPAQARVDIIKAKTGLTKLTPHENIGDKNQTCFWYVCKAEEVPIDPLVSVQIISSPRPLWAENDYISMSAALERKHKAKNLKLHPLEIDKVRAASKG